MKVVRTTDSTETRATAPIFDGTVHARMLIDAATSPNVTVNLVRFSDGARTRPHTHTADQILYITEGHGIVAAEGVENAVTGGDVVHVPAGTVHWHGAAAAHDMAHLAILPPCDTKVLDS